MIQPYVTLTERGILSVAITGDFAATIFEGRRDSYDPSVWPEDAPKKPKNWDASVDVALKSCEEFLNKNFESVSAHSYGEKHMIVSGKYKEPRIVTPS